MITERPDIDIELLKDKLLTDDDNTINQVMDEIAQWRQYDFLCLVSENDDEIDGFMIGWRVDNYLWIHQAWHKVGDWVISKGAMEMAKDWARKRGMTHLRGETTRNEMLALKRFGWYEQAVIMRCDV